MAKSALIVGESGTGKSTAIEKLNPKETFIINVQGKDLPFKQKGYVKCSEGKPPAEGNLYYTDKIATILKLVSYISENRKDIKNIVVDDAQYIAVNEFMNRLYEKGFNKFNDVGFGIWSLPEVLPRLREDLFVFIIYHSELATDDNGDRFHRAKQMGKLAQQQVGGIEGYFTYVIFTEVERKEDGIHHNFVTNNEGDTTAKTPKGMFDLRIPNDLNFVREGILEFSK
jgi:hypothetical protein